ncbi:MAG: hypothetical protein AB1761_17815 [Pseudomonadota bacterium]
MLRRAVLSLVLYGAMRAGIALADAPPQLIEWICGLESSQAEAIRCQLQQAVPGQFADATYERVDARQIRTELLRPDAARNVTRLVREAPERYADEIWWIPLHRAPTDLALVQELARSVMCGSDRACRVLFVGAVGSVATLHRQR